MMSRLTARVIFGFLFLLSFGALGIAITSIPILKTTSFVITVDCDSLRTESIEELMESLHDNYVFLLATQEIQKGINTFHPAEHVTVTRNPFGPVRIDITSTKPVLMVSNRSLSICLSTNGIPFPYRPEHGNLPRFHVPADIDQETLLQPDGFIQEFYRLILEIQTGALSEIGRFSHLLAGDAFSLLLLDSSTGNRLRIPSECLRNRTIPLYDIDNWLSSRSFAVVPLEIDARFPGIVVLRTFKEDVHHG